VQVLGFREGDVALDDAATEIAEEQARADKTKARARADAEAAAAKVKGGAKLDALYPKPNDADEADLLKRAAAPPSVQETNLFARKGDMVPEVGVSPELAKRAFEGKAGDLVGPLEVGGAWVVAVVKERKEPDKDFFEKHKGEELRKAEREKWGNVLQAWSKQRCVETRDEGRIKVNDAVLEYEGLAPEKGEPRYQACGGGAPRITLGGMQ
jgi:hypothetical protein